MNKEQINKRVLIAIDNILKLNPKLTRTALSELLGIPLPKFSHITKLNMYAPVEVMASLCLKFNISADWLLTGRGDMQNEPGGEQSLNHIGMVMQLVDTIKQQAQEIGQMKERIRQLESGMKSDAEEELTQTITAGLQT